MSSGPGPLRRILPPWRLGGWEWCILGTVGALFVAHVSLVEKHTAFKRPPGLPMCDLGVYLRTAWAVRSGEDLYQVTDWHGWHYIYPPFTAIAFTPLALPPPGLKPSGFYVPFGASVFIWYASSVACLVLAVLILGHALEAATPLPVNPLVGNDRRRWWGLRGLPLLICAGAIFTSLARGQMEAVVLALVASAIACTIFKYHFRAGFFLGLAASIKLFPVMLLLYPLWRRNLRCLAGAGAAFAITFVLVPVAALGPARAVASYHQFYNVMIAPAVAHGSDSSRHAELLTMEIGDSQSLLTALHNLTHITTIRDFRPQYPSDALTLGVRVLGVLLLGITLWAAGRRREETPSDAAIFYGALMAVTLLIIPISHSHYSGLMVPLFMGIGACDIARFGHVRRLSVVLMSGYFACDVLNRIDTAHFSMRFRDLGIPTLANLIFWFLAVCLLRAGRRSGSAGVDRPR